MRYSDSPVLSLVTLHMTLRGADRKGLGQSLACGGNPTKAFRRLDQLLRGESLIPEFVRMVADTLQIPSADLAGAWNQHRQIETAKRAEENRKFMEAAMERRGPHLWGILPNKYYPSLITILGPEFWLLVKLPPEVTRMPHRAQMREVGALARDHYQNRRRCRLAGYEYRRSLNEVFRFGVDGEYLGRSDAGPLEPRTFVRVGASEFDTSRGFFRGGSAEA